MQGFAAESFDYILLDAPCSALGLRPRLTHHTTLPQLQQVSCLPLILQTYDLNSGQSYDLTSMLTAFVSLFIGCMAIGRGICYKAVRTGHLALLIRLSATLTRTILLLGADCSIPAEAIACRSSAAQTRWEVGVLNLYHQPRYASALPPACCIW